MTVLHISGRQCQRPRDSCHPNPCQNHGQCIMDDLRGFICECKDGNTGRLCEKLIGKNGKRIRKRFAQYITYSGLGTRYNIVATLA